MVSSPPSPPETSTDGTSVRNPSLLRSLIIQLVCVLMIERVCVEIGERWRKRSNKLKLPHVLAATWPLLLFLHYKYFGKAA
jgi:hypothetical protein